MRTPSIGLLGSFCALSLLLLLPALVWADWSTYDWSQHASLHHDWSHHCKTRDLTLPVTLAALGVMVLTPAYTAFMRAFMRRWERRNGITLHLPRFWSARSWAVGAFGFIYAFVIEAGLLSSHDNLGNHFELSDAALVVFLITTPLVLLTAYGARTWHRGQRPAA